MAITINCPFCGTSADIEEALLGKKLRCADKNCRKAFRITPDGQALPVVERDKSVKKTQPDWAANPPPPMQGGTGEGDWLSAPPPQGGGGYAPPPRRGMAAPTISEEADWQPEGMPLAAEAYEDAEETYEAQDGHYYNTYPTKSKKGKVIGIGILLLLTLGIIGGAAFFFVKQKDNKEKMEADAEAFVNGGQWARAKEAFGKLSTQYNDPANKKRYEPFLKWIDLQLDLGSTDKLKNAESSLGSFYTDYKSEDFYRDKGFRSKVWGVATQIADQSAAEADKSASDEWLAAAERMLKIAKDTSSGEKDQPAAEAKMAAAEKKIDAAREAIATAGAAQAVENELAKAQRAKKPELIERVQAAYAKALQAHPRLAQNADLSGKIEALRADEPKWVTYKPLGEDAQKPKDDADAASLLVSPPIKAAPANAAGEGVVLAVARGTVYGLSAKDGEPRWAIRVGVDSQGLPARLPTRRGQADYALVLSQNADKQTILNAIDVNTGKQLWRRPLSAPCPAGPLLVGFRAYVPTLDGKLSVINVADGKLVGVFETGARLTVPLGIDRKNNILYAPADAKRIFVFDVSKNRCTDVIYTNHAAGLLRGAPIVAGHSRLGAAAGEAGGQSTFVIAEGAGLGGLKVRVFPCQAKGKDFKPVDEFSLPGQSWFTPYYDGDVLGLVTDKGFLAIYGVNRETADPKPLVPVVETLIPGLAPQGVDPSNIQPKARAQVAFVALGEWWVLAENKLVHVRIDPFRKQVVPAPALTVDLGSPLHESTLSPDGRLVIVVSLSPDRRILATALDRVSGAVVWQRQLGLAPTQDSVSLGDEALTIDKSGALFVADAKQLPPKMDKPWLAIGEWPAGAVKGMTYARLLVTPSGRAAVALAYNSLTQQITLRKFEPGKGVVADRTFRLASPPFGSATVSDSGTVIVPCRDGNLHEFNLNSPNPTNVRLTWRDPGAAPSVAGHAVLLSDNELIATDGLRKLQRWERASGKNWSRVQAADIALPGKLTTPLLGLKDENDQPSVCVGDETGKIHVLAVGAVPNQREWEVKGTITRGPFRIGPGRVGCIADNRKLIWFDLAGQPGQFLGFDAAADGDVEAGIVGQPQAVGDYLLVPELSGKFTWLNLKTGEPAAPAITLGGSLVPAAGAVPLGKNWSFAPLSDGTVMLLPLPKHMQ